MVRWGLPDSNPVDSNESHFNKNSSPLFKIKPSRSLRHGPSRVPPVPPEPLASIVFPPLTPITIGNGLFDEGRLLLPFVTSDEQV